MNCQIRYNDPLSIYCSKQYVANKLNIYSRKILSIIFLFFMCGVTHAHQSPTVLITGGESGIGKAIVDAFASQGWNVWSTTRNKISEGHRSNVITVSLDLRNQKEINQLLKKIYKKHKNIDVLVNNAGYGLLGAIETVDIEQVKVQMEVNYYSPIMMIQAVLPKMRDAKKGHIINISSTSGIRAVPALGYYAASKKALEGMTEALAAEVSQWNIKTTIIQPASVNNAFINNCINGSREENKIVEYAKISTALSKVIATRAEQGQQETEIGNLVFNVAMLESPPFRIQTNEQGIGIASRVYKDISGNVNREEIKIFTNNLLNIS